MGIVGREIYDNLNSLRFALTAVLLFGLMLTNAIVYLREQPVRTENYRTAARAARNEIEARAESLYALGQKGPGNLYKKPATLHFSASGSAPYLANVVEGSHSLWEDNTLKGFWLMKYPAATPNLTNIRPAVTKVDWVFIIGSVLSLIALLFTFDVVSGERERGTLRLLLATPIPRYRVLLGKFVGALFSISIPFIIAVLMNLLLISTSPAVHLTADTWVRLGIICGIAVLYVSLFIAFGIFVSACVQRSAVSLVVLLLTWVTFVVFVPSLLAPIASGFSTPMSADALKARQDRLDDKNWNAYVRVLGASELGDMQAGSRYVLTDVAGQQRLIDERLTEQIAQTQRARAITRISPTAVLQHLVESFAGTGFTRHLQFLENTQRYAREYRQFIIDTDAADPESPHFVGVPKGMSQRPVAPESIPHFTDTVSLRRDFNGAAVDLLLLTLLFGVLFAAAFLAFLRMEV